MLGALVLCPLVSSLSLTLSLSSPGASKFKLIIASISTVPPAYYAHLAAFRARFYMERDTSDSGSTTSGVGGGRGPAGPGGAASRSTRGPAAGATVKPLPAIKDNVKRVMFYC